MTTNTKTEKLEQQLPQLREKWATMALNYLQELRPAHYQELATDKNPQELSDHIQAKVQAMETMFTDLLIQQDLPWWTATEIAQEQNLHCPPELEDWEMEAADSALEAMTEKWLVV